MLYEKLAAIIKAERISHAWLLTGQAEQTLEQAVFLAQALLCHRLLPNGQPCGECPACRKINAGNHPDLQLIIPKGASVKIEQTRAMQYLASLEAYEGGRRVVIIHQAHTMPPAAANSLLKILEEPRPGLYLILTAPLGDSLLETILSRVVWLRLPENLPTTAESGDAGSIYTSGYLAELNKERELRAAMQAKCSRLFELLKQPQNKAALLVLARTFRDDKQSGLALKQILAVFLEELLQKLRDSAAAAIYARHQSTPPGRPDLAADELQALAMAALVEEARRNVDGNIKAVLLLSVLFLQMNDILTKEA